MPEPRRTYARRHMFNVVRAIDFGLCAAKPPATRIGLDADAAERLRSEFDGRRRPDTHAMTAPDRVPVYYTRSRPAARP